MGSIVGATFWPLYPWKRDAVPIVQETGWATQPVWTGTGNLPPLGFNPQSIQPVVSHCTDCIQAEEVKSLIF
jgi:hypothetical protein